MAISSDVNLQLCLGSDQWGLASFVLGSQILTPLPRPKTVLKDSNGTPLLHQQLGGGQTQQN